jgi:hypothetical protein
MTLLYGGHGGGGGGGGHGGGGGGHGGGGGGGHGGGHGGGYGKGGGGDGKWQYLAQRQTQYIWDAGYDDTPLVPFLQYESHGSSGFMGCMSRAINYCDRSFAGEGFRACIHGVLLASDLLPAGVNGGIMDVDGGFSAGLQIVCPRDTIDVIPRVM